MIIDTNRFLPSRKERIMEIVKSVRIHKLAADHLEEVKEISNIEDKELQEKRYQDLFKRLSIETEPEIMKQIAEMDRNHKLCRDFWPLYKEES